MNHFSCCLALSLTMSTRCACLSVRFGVCCVCYIPNRVISSRRLSHTIFQRICRLKIRFAANQSSVFTSNPVFSCIPFLSSCALTFLSHPPSTRPGERALQQSTLLSTVAVPLSTHPSRHARSLLEQNSPLTLRTVRTVRSSTDLLVDILSQDPL